MGKQGERETERRRPERKKARVGRSYKWRSSTQRDDALRALSYPAFQEVAAQGTLPLHRLAASAFAVLAARIPRPQSRGGVSRGSRGHQRKGPRGGGIRGLHPSDHPRPGTGHRVCRHHIQGNSPSAKARRDLWHELRQVYHHTRLVPCAILPRPGPCTHCRAEEGKWERKGTCCLCHCRSRLPKLHGGDGV